MAKIIQGELMPPETIQCDCCNTTLRFGLGECPNCLARIIYNRNTPSNVIKQCALFFVFPFSFVFLWIPELGHAFGWPITVAVSLVLGGMVAKWAFKGNWPKRHSFKKPRFYRRTVQGYSTKTIIEERDEATKPYELLVVVPYVIACEYAAYKFTPFVFGLFGANTENIDFRIYLLFALVFWLGGLFYANRRGWLDWLTKLEKRFFA